MVKTGTPKFQPAEKAFLERLIRKYVPTGKATGFKETMNASHLEEFYRMVGYYDWEALDHMDAGVHTYLFSVVINYLFRACSLDGANAIIHLKSFHSDNENFNMTELVIPPFGVNVNEATLDLYFLVVTYSQKRRFKLIHMPGEAMYQTLSSDENDIIVKERVKSRPETPRSQSSNPSVEDKDADSDTMKEETPSTCLSWLLTAAVALGALGLGVVAMVILFSSD